MARARVCVFPAAVYKLACSELYTFTAHMAKVRSHVTRTLFAQRPMQMMCNSECVGGWFVGGLLGKTGKTFNVTVHDSHIVATSSCYECVGVFVCVFYMKCVR